MDYVSITNVFDQLARLSLRRLSLWSLNHDFYIPLTISLEGNWLLEADSRAEVTSWFIATLSLVPAATCRCGTTPFFLHPAALITPHGRDSPPALNLWGGFHCNSCESVFPWLLSPSTVALSPCSLRQRSGPCCGLPPRGPPIPLAPPLVTPSPGSTTAPPPVQQLARSVGFPSPLADTQTDS